MSDPPSLYAEGWRRGSFLAHSLTAPAFVERDGVAHRQDVEANLWVVVSQDCDLFLSPVSDDNPRIELRPVYTASPPHNWGIRSRKLRLTPDRYIESESPRVMVSARLLDALRDSREDEILDEARIVAMTTWLGLRYNRPAVPQHLVTLAKRIAKEVAASNREDLQDAVRDVFMQFDDSGDIVRYSLIAVTYDEAVNPDVRAWLAEIATEVPQELGIGDEFVAGTAREIALSVVEEGYIADLSQITWDQ